MQGEEEGDMKNVLARVAAVIAVLAGLVVVSNAPAGAVPTITFDGSPGTAAPPATLGPYTMTAFPADGRPIGAAVTTVPSPLGGDVGLSPAASHRRIGAGWASWSH